MAKNNNLNIFDLDDEYSEFDESIAKIEQEENRCNLLSPGSYEFTVEQAVRTHQQEIVIAAKQLAARSALVNRKVMLCHKKNDKSAVVSADLKFISINDARLIRKGSVSTYLDTIRTNQTIFDTQKIIVNRQAIFSAGKIKQTKSAAKGNVEQICFSASSQQNAKETNDYCSFFASISENDLNNLVEKNGDAELLIESAVIYPDFTSYQHTDVELNQEVIAEEGKILESIGNLNTNDEEIVLSFDREAQYQYDSFLVYQMRQIEQSDDHPTLQAALTYQCEFLLPKFALLLHIDECAEKNELISQDSAVGITAFDRAMVWINQIEVYTKKLFKKLYPEDVIQEAIRAKVIEGKIPESFTLNELMRQKWRNLAEYEKVEKTVRLLVSRGLLIETKISSTDKGGRPTSRYRFAGVTETQDIAISAELTSDYEINDTN